MPVAELHFFDADDPNGSTIFECTTDDEFVKGIHLNIERDSLGGGTVNFARKVPGGLFVRDIVFPEVLVRVLVPAISETKYYHGFFINPRQQQVVSKAEQGGKGFTFGGPGPKHYLERMLLWSASFSGNDNAVDRDAGVWTWPETAKVGRVLSRLIQEDTDNPTGPFLPDLTKSFGDVNDSDGVPWTDDVSGTEDLILRIQDNYLKIMWILEDLSGMVTDIDLGEVGDPLLQLNAYQTYGTDRTASILFEEGVNIAADLDVEGSSYAKASHALVKGNDGAYELAVRPGWSAGQLKKIVPTAWDTSNNVQLDNAGERYLSRQQFGEQQIKLHIIPGTTALAGEYFPGPPGTGSDFWTGDVVSLTTGLGSPTELDYDDEPQAVTGIELELTDAVRDDTTLMAARSWDISLSLNEERKSNNTSRDLAGSRGTVTAPPNIIRFCLPTIPPTESGGSTILSLTWDFETSNLDNGTSTYDLMASRQDNPISGPVGTWWGHNGGLSTQPQIDPRVPIVAGQVVRVQGDFSKQLSSTTSVSSVLVRFYTSAVSGTPIDTQSIGIPASGNGLGIVATIDSTVIAPTGANYFTIAPGRNLYGDNITLSVEGAFIPDDPGIERSGLLELVGSSTRAARCDHRHHVLRDVTPQITDDALNGYPDGTFWIVVDDVDAPTTIFATYLSVDSTEGAAVWITDPDDSGDGDETEPNLRWEPVTNGEDVFVWLADDLVLEFKDYSL